MLNATILLLKEKNLLNVSSLGGGTALAAYYWNYRYSTINNSEELKELFLVEINQMNPNIEYEFLAKNIIKYLDIFLENICASYDIGIELSNQDFIDIENYVFNEITIYQCE